MSKRIKIIISTLVIILGMVTYSAVKSYFTSKKTITIKTYDTENMQTIDKEIIVDKLNKENSMNVYSGTATIQTTYSNEEIIGSDVSFRWLKKWFAEENSRSLTVKAKYKVMFTYDLNNLPIEVKGNKVIITISKNRLTCDVNLIENESLFTDRVGFFESDFSPQEINSLNERTKILVLNTLQTKEEYRAEAINNLKENLKTLLVGYNVEFNVLDYDVVENDNVKVK